MSHDPFRLLIAAALLLAWCALTAAIVWRVRRSAVPAHGALLVAHASQTGFAAEIAERSAAALQSAGVPALSIALGRLSAADLAEAEAMLFVVSTTGEGDAPDDAQSFLRSAMASTAPLGGLRYALLALGDRSYGQFCAFGHALDHWLRQSGGHPAADLIELDNGDPAGLRRWQERLQLFGAAADAAEWVPPAYRRWRLAERSLLNPGSPGGPVHLLRLVAEEDMPAWDPGAIAEVYPGPAGEAERAAHAHRAYSVASVTEDGAVDLVVRHHPHGLGSSWLCEGSRVGDPVALRLRANPGFAPADRATPVILIGNGTGIAGLRAHLRARPAGTRNWLLFGERTATHDALFEAELMDMLACRRLERLDRSFSRDDPSQPYVQHLVAREARLVRQWIDEGAAIYVCGSMAGMAAGVDEALAAALGRERLDALAEEGRYRRDVY